MLPRALRGSYCQGGIHKHGGDCRMRDENSVVYSFFNFYMDQSTSRKRNGLKIQPQEQSGTKKV